MLVSCAGQSSEGVVYASSELGMGAIRVGEVEAVSINARGGTLEDSAQGCQSQGPERLATGPTRPMLAPLGQRSVPDDKRMYYVFARREAAIRVWRPARQNACLSETGAP